MSELRGRAGRRSPGVPLVRHLHRRGASTRQTGTRGVSYPTVRNRLDEILAKLDGIERDVDKRRHAILDRLESGKLSAKDAAEELKKVGL